MRRLVSARDFTQPLGAATAALPKGLPRVTSIVVAVMLMLLWTTAAPAQANGAESDQASVLVQQAIALVAGDAGPARISERINDALEAPNQEGVDAVKVRQALAVVEGVGAQATASQRTEAMLQAHSLLQASIAVTAPLKPNMATGEETGTTVVLDDFQPPRGIGTRGDLALVVLSLLAIGGGLLLARWLRPPHTLRQLRRQTTTKGA